MGQQVNFYLYRVKKAVNTTWRPANYEDGTRVNGYIIHPCSIIKPIFKLSYPQGQDIQYYTYNYAYVPIFKRWYWVKDVVFQDGLMEFHLEVDVLASYRADIAGKNFYIVRTSNGSNPGIVDRLYPASVIPVRKWNSATPAIWSAEGVINNGTFVVGIVGSSGVSKYFAFRPPDFNTFCRTVFSSLQWWGEESTIKEVGEDVIKTVLNPAQYITSVLWFPTIITGDSVTKIPIGWWGVDATAGEIKRPLTSIKASVEIPKHTQAATRGEWLNSFPYRRIKIDVPGFGVCELNPAKVKGDTISIDVTFDCRNGSASCNIHDGGIQLAKLFSQVGVSVAISDIQTNVLGSLVSGIGGVASVLTGNVIGAVNGVAGMVDNLIKQDVTHLSSQGGMSALYPLARAFTDIYEIVEEDNPDNGRPYMKNGSMHELGEGFYIVENGNIPIAGATEEETAKVKDFLERGMYYNL